MKSLLIRNIKSLVGIRDRSIHMIRGAEMKTLPSIGNAYLLVEDGLIKSYGENSEAPEHADEVIDATGKFVLPCWCDPHTHLVYAGSREEEFVHRINGMSKTLVDRQEWQLLGGLRRCHGSRFMCLFVRQKS